MDLPDIFLHILTSLKKRPVISALFCLVLFITLAFICLLIISSFEKYISNTMESVKIEYYEDSTAEASFYDIFNGIQCKQFIPSDNNHIFDGNTDSSWWFRLRLKDTIYEKTGKHITINNSDNKITNLYVPIIRNGSITYIAMHSGYKDDVSNDDAFLCPSFRLPSNIVPDQYIYIELKSPEHLKVEINLYSENEYQQFIINILLTYGLLFGSLITLLVYVFFTYFLSFNDLSYLLLTIVIVLQSIMIIFDTGINILFAPNVLYDSLFIYKKIFSCMAIALFAALVMNFFETRKCFPKTNFVFKGYITLMIGTMLLSLTNLPVFNKVNYIITISFFLYYNYFIFYAFLLDQIKSKILIASICIALIPSLYPLFKQGSLFYPNVAFKFPPTLFTVASLFLLVLAVNRKYKTEETESKRAISQLIIAREILKIRELEFLQAQIKPHFLHNAINVIITLCRIDSLKARELILDLSKYLRHSFDFENLSNLVPFSAEFEFIQAYVNLEKARFGDRLTFSCDLENTDELLLPPLILQPIVENAIRHGIRKSINPGTVVLQVKDLGNKFYLSVFDNGSGMTEEEVNSIINSKWKKGGGIGIKNINSRLKKLYGTCLNVESSPGHGTNISFELPKNN